MGCGGSGKIGWLKKDSKDTSFTTWDDMPILKDCSGCEDCYECEYWILRRGEYPIKPTHGYKCGRCGTCCDEGDEILMRRKEEE